MSCSLCAMQSVLSYLSWLLSAHAAITRAKAVTHALAETNAVVCRLTPAAAASAKMPRHRMGLPSPAPSLQHQANLLWPGPVDQRHSKPRAHVTDCEVTDKLSRMPAAYLLPGCDPTMNRVLEIPLKHPKVRKPVHTAQHVISQCA